MAGEAEMRRRIADPCVQVVDVRGVGVGERQAMAVEAEPFEHALQQVERAALRRRHTRATDQLAGERDRVDQAVNPHCREFPNSGSPFDKLRVRTRRRLLMLSLSKHEPTEGIMIQASIPERKSKGLNSSHKLANSM